MGPGPAGVPGKAPGWGGDFAVSQRGSHGEPDFGRFGGGGDHHHLPCGPGAGDWGPHWIPHRRRRAHLRSRDFHAANRRRLPGCGSVHRPAGPDGGGHFPGCHRFGGRRPVPGADAAWGLCTGDRGSAGCGLPDCRGAEGDPHSGPGAAAKRVAHSHCALSRVSHRCPSAGDGGAAPVPGRYGVRRDGICRPVSPCPCPQGPGRPDPGLRSHCGPHRCAGAPWRGHGGHRPAGRGGHGGGRVGRPGDQPDRRGSAHPARI